MLTLRAPSSPASCVCGQQMFTNYCVNDSAVLHLLFLNLTQLCEYTNKILDVKHKCIFQL